MTSAIPAPASPKAKASMSRMHRDEARLAYLLMLPSTLGILIFGILPIFASLGISFTNWGGLSMPQWVGTDSYQKVLTDIRSQHSFLVTLKYTLLSVPVGVAFSLGLAVLIHNLTNTWLSGIFRTVYYLPMVTIGVAVALLWTVLLQPDGLINLVLQHLFGIKGPNWLADANWVLPAVALFSIWQGAGQSVILFLASLAAVPKDLYEAAQLDGASGLQAFRRITLPMISPTLFLVLVLSLISSLQVFDAVLVLSRGGPGDASTSTALHIYRLGFKYFKFGEAAALAWVLTAVLAVLLIVQWRSQNRWVNYDQV